MAQQEDLTLFARLLLALCCNNPAAANNLHKSLESISRHYSADVKNVVLFLIPKPGPVRVSRIPLINYICIRANDRYQQNIQQVFDMIGSKLLMELDSTHLSVVRFLVTPAC